MTLSAFYIMAISMTFSLMSAENNSKQKISNIIFVTLPDHSVVPKLLFDETMKALKTLCVQSRQSTTVYIDLMNLYQQCRTPRTKPYLCIPSLYRYHLTNPKGRIHPWVKNVVRNTIRVQKETLFMLYLNNPILLISNQ